MGPTDPLYPEWLFSCNFRNICTVLPRIGIPISFEMKVDPAQWTDCKDRLLRIVDLEQDSLRFYFLGNNWHRRVEHHGTKQGYDVDGPLIV